MKRKMTVLLVALALFMSVFSACAGQQPPPSKTVETSYNINLFSDFGEIGLSPVLLYIDVDLSGYMEYYYNRAHSASFDTQLKNLVDRLNKRAFTKEDDFNNGYRVVYYNEDTLTADDKGHMSIKIQFVNINYLKSEVTVVTLSDYLQTYNANETGFLDRTGSPVSLINVPDTGSKYVISVKGAVNQIPVVMKNTQLVCHDDESLLVSASKDTVKFSNADFIVVVSRQNTPVLLITAVIALVVVLAAAVSLKFFILPKMRAR